MAYEFSEMQHLHSEVLGEKVSEEKKNGVHCSYEKDINLNFITNRLKVTLHSQPS